MAVDPICKMDVDEKSAKWSVNTRGKNITSVPRDVKKSLMKILKSTQKNKKPLFFFKTFFFLKNFNFSR